MPSKSKEDSNTQAVPFYSFLVSGLRDSLSSKWTAAHEDLILRVGLSLPYGGMGLTVIPGWTI